MKNFFQRIWDIAVTVWAVLCGVASYADKQTRAFIRAMLIILGVEAGLLLVGFVLNLKGLIVFAAVVASLVVLVAWKASDLAVKLISAVAGKIPFVRTVISPATEELKKLLPPMVTFSLFLAFIGAIAAIKGPAYFTWADLMVWTAVILTSEIFFVLYLDSKMKMAGWLMIGFMYYLLIGSYLQPIQAQGFVNWVERNTIRRSMIAMDRTKDYELVAIPNNTPLYEQGWWKGFKRVKITTATLTTAKVVSRKDDPASKEPMYEVVLPVEGTGNLYVGGETLYVPARLTKPVQIETASATQAAKYDIVPQVSEGWRVEGADLVADLQPGEETSRSFQIAEGTSTPWIRIPLGNYCFRFTNLQTVVMDDGSKQIVIHPEDYYDMGSGGEKRLKFMALKGGASVVVTAQRKA